MFELQILPRLQALLPPMVIRTRFYRVAGMPESDLDQLIAPVYTRYANPVTTILAAQADIQIRLHSRQTKNAKWNCQAEARPRKFRLVSKGVDQPH